jgi:hypothetical protein
MTKTDLKTFDDLEFKPHPMAEWKKGSVQAKHTFPNDYTISVVGGPSGCGLYGNGTSSFEVAIFTPDGDFYESPDMNDQVRGWCSKTAITKIMANIQNKK